MKTRMKALDKLEAASLRNRSLLCVGLDPDPEKIPACLEGEENAVTTFNRAIIEATRDQVCAYKPNLAFFEAGGTVGWQALTATLAAIPDDILVILDAKRGDIGNTAKQYATALFDTLGGDAATVHPYMGRDSLRPFVDHADRLTVVLAATSNPGGAEIQGFRGPGDLPLYRYVARMAAEMHGRPGAVALVAGATRPAQIAEIREDAPGLWLLVPGIGAQGGDLAEALRHGLDARGSGVMINTSRSILYASAGSDFAGAARREAIRMKEEIDEHRP
jgi:orotidine-5'-phosphate decarboxylase